MNWIQRLFTRPAGPTRRADMEAESRQWLTRCLTCGHISNVWEMGGVRYKAAGQSRNLLFCKPCGRKRCHLIYWGGPTGAPGAPEATGAPLNTTDTKTTGGSP